MGNSNTLEERALSVFCARYKKERYKAYTQVLIEQNEAKEGPIYKYIILKELSTAHSTGQCNCTNIAQNKIDLIIAKRKYREFMEDLMHSTDDRLMAEIKAELKQH